MYRNQIYIKIAELGRLAIQLRHSMQLLSSSHISNILINNKVERIATPAPIFALEFSGGM